MDAPEPRHGEPPDRYASAGDGRRPDSRMALAVVATAVIALLADRLLPGVAEPPMLAPLLALAAAAATGLALVHRSVAPLARAHGELHDRYVAVLAEALEDPLTHLGNHRAFQEELDRQVAAATRYGEPVALILIDLDDFKGTNDTEGHAAGDRTLARFGRIVLNTVRRADRAFRIGGTSSPSSCRTPMPPALRRSADGSSPRRCSRCCATRRARRSRSQPACRRSPNSPRIAHSCTRRPIPRSTSQSAADAPPWRCTTAPPSRAHRTSARPRRRSPMSSPAGCCAPSFSRSWTSRPGRRSATRASFAPSRRRRSPIRRRSSRPRNRAGGS